MIVAIAGATGLTGGICLKHLLLNPGISEVIAIGRKSSGAQHPKLREVMLIGNQLSQFVQADAFISCLGTTIKKAGSEEAFKAIDLDLPVHLAETLHDYGCTTAAVISAMGADATSSILYTRTKGQMETEMRSIGFKSLTILRPSFIIGSRSDERFGEKAAQFALKLLSPFLIGPLANYKTVKAEDVSLALIQGMLNQKVGSTVYLSGDIKGLANSLQIGVKAGEN